MAGSTRTTSGGRSKRTRKGRGGASRVTRTPAGSAVDRLGPAPGVPKAPKVDVDLGLGKIKQDLKQARKEGKKAVTGQLRAIDDRIGGKLAKQGARYDRQSDRIIRGMRRMDRRARDFNVDRRRGIRAEQARLMRAGDVRTAGLTGSRSRMAETQADALRATTRATERAGERVDKATGRALGAGARINRRSSGSSMSIVDVLAAERKSDDVKYMADLRMQERMMELQQAHDIRMQQMQFNQSIYQTKLAQALEQDYLTWQHDQGFLLKPAEEAALNWKYERKGQMLEYRLAEREAAKKGNNEGFKAFDTYLDTAEATTASAATLMAAPNFDKKVDAIMKENPNLTREAAAVNYISANSVAPPEGTAPVADRVIKTMVSTGTTPTFEDVRGIISEADPTGTVDKFMKQQPQRLDKLHEQYRALNAAVIGTETYKSVLSGDEMETDPGLLPAGETGFGGQPGGGGGGLVDSAADATGDMNIPGIAGVAAIGVGGTALTGRAAKRFVDKRAASSIKAYTGLDAPSSGSLKDDLKRVGEKLKAQRWTSQGTRVGANPTELDEVLKGTARGKAVRAAVDPLAKEAGEVLTTIARDSGIADEIFRTTNPLVEGGVRGATDAVQRVGAEIPEAAPEARIRDTAPRGQGQLRVRPMTEAERAAGLDTAEALTREAEERAAQRAAMTGGREAAEGGVRAALRGAGRVLGTAARVAGPALDVGAAADAAVSGRVMGIPIGPAAAEYGKRLGLIDEAQARELADNYGGWESVMDAAREADASEEDVWHMTATQFRELGSMMENPDYQGPGAGGNAKEFLDFVKANSLEADMWDEDRKWELFQYGVRALRDFYERNR